MNRRIILVTGGQRSGKSEYAEKLALRLSDSPVYIATARAYDDEFRERIRKHQLRRGPQWTNIEEEISPAKYDITGQTVLVDCLTLWATNIFFACGEDATPALKQLTEEIDKLTDYDAQIIFVTNEIGLGGVSENAMRRHFTDLLGRANQYVAAKADEVTMLISGIPLKIK